MSINRHLEEGMHRICILCLSRTALLAGFVAGGLAAPTNVIVTPAHAQASAGVSVEADFHLALEPFGAWRHHRRFGDVWVPANRARDWRPYTAGHWVYTDDYGWYWVADDQEADWGWITYHYGRWYRDADYGWFWIPNDVWGPAWVDWRYGDQYVGWAPEPPDEIADEVQDEPRYWSFVSAGNLIAPSIARVLLPFDRRAEFFRRTELVNRPVMMRDRRFAVNPGVPPGNIAAIRGRPLPTYQVRPRLLAGTAALPGAVQVRAADLRRDREAGNRLGARERAATRDIIRSSNTIRPPRAAPQPQPLGRGEVGRLGATPPRAARNAAVVQDTAKRAPETPSVQRQQGEQRQTAAPQMGGGAERRRGNITPPNTSPPTAQAPVGPRAGRVEQRAAEQRSRERTPAAHAPSRNQGIAQRGPAARPPANRPPAVATLPRVNRPPAVAVRPQVNRSPAAPPTINRPPAFAQRPQPRPIGPPAAVPRPAAPPAAAARPAPPPAALGRPAAPPAAARPATVGAAPHGGLGQKRPQ
jgi:hypothetical protein